MLGHRTIRLFPLAALATLLAGCPPPAPQSFFIVIFVTLSPATDPGTFQIVADPGPNQVSLGSNLKNGSTVPATPLPATNNTLVVSGFSGTDITTYDVKWDQDCTQQGANGLVVIPVNSTSTCTLVLTRKTVGPPPQPEPVACSVFDDGYTNMQGPSSAIFISGRTKSATHPDERGKACVPDGQFGICRRWFGRCQTVTTNSPVTFQVFDDGSANPSAQSDAVYIPATGNRACVPDQTSNGTCRRWFGNAVTSDGRSVSCTVFDDGSSNQTSSSTAIYIPSPLVWGGRACIPDPGPTGLCRRWFGNCAAQPK